MTPLNMILPPAVPLPIETLPAEGPLTVGNRVLATRYWLSPLAGYTQLPFRRVVRELGGLGLATTDLVLATNLLAGHPHTLELIATTPDDEPLSIQIFGGQLAALVQAAQWLADQGFGGVDLNLGCPMAKINGQGGGARLMCDAVSATKLVASVVEAVPIPVTVKMRLGWDRNSIVAPQLAREFESVGVAAITLHGRTRAQGFHGTVDLEAIAATVAAVSRIPIIGNGDVRSVADALRMRQVTGCAAVAIGRGALIDPWIFRKLADQAENRPVRDPTAAEQIAFLERHFELMLAQHQQRGCILFRKFAGWYGATLGIPDELEDRLRRLESPAMFTELVDEIRARHGERQRPFPTALIKVPNGPVEHW